LPTGKDGGCGEEAAREGRRSREEAGNARRSIYFLRRYFHRTSLRPLAEAVPDARVLLVLLGALVVSTWSEVLCMGATWPPAAVRWPALAALHAVAGPRASLLDGTVGRVVHVGMGGALLAVCVAMIMARERAVWRFGVELLTGGRRIKAKSS
jgi:hypothetical protein